jgi:hypothetical protein
MMKKIVMIFMAMFAFGIQNVSAQDAPLKIVTNHPDFNIKISRCVANGKTVIIDLLLINEGTNDVEGLYVGGGHNGTEAYDNEGNIYVSGLKVKIANRPEYSSSQSGFNIPAGVPMKLSISIDGVSQSAESIARLKIRIDCQAWGINSNKPVRISNIPITRN